MQEQAMVRLSELNKRIRSVDFQTEIYKKQTKGLPRTSVQKISAAVNKEAEGVQDKK